jgi:hypothetical protein
MSTEQSQYVLVNTTEEVVKNYAPTLMANAGGCSCEKCLLDVWAMTLNRFNGNYIILKKGDNIQAAVKAGLSIEEEDSIVESIMKSVDIVKSSPGH